MEILLSVIQHLYCILKTFIKFNNKFCVMVDFHNELNILVKSSRDDSTTENTHDLVKCSFLMNTNVDRNTFTVETGFAYSLK